jgi:isopenicillin N synthase-like dioxygenase
MSQSIPIVDLSRWRGGDETERDRIARQFDDACREWGFAVIAGHGVPAELMAAINRVTKAYFDLPAETKLAVNSTGRQGGRGYYALKEKSHARTRGDATAPGDLRESFRMGDASAPNVWPEAPDDMAEIWSTYFAALNRLGVDLMHVAARALGLPDGWFDDKMDRPASVLAAQHYPALDAEPVAGQLRSGAHTDFGNLTMLMTEDKPGGLEIMGLDGLWHPVKPLPGTFIINIGDLMGLWTNDRWRSTLHRVVNPPPEAHDSSRRLSIVFFYEVNDDALIECISTCVDAEHPAKYVPIRAGEHIAAKLRSVETVRAGRAEEH